MKNQSSKLNAGKLDECKGILHQLAEEGDEEEKKQAKKMLKALEPDEEPKDKDKDKEGDQDKEAKALRAAALSVSEELAQLRAEMSARDRRDAEAAAAQRRSALFAKRPDFSAAQRETLAAVPVDVLEKAVEKWPRASASPGAAAAAVVEAAGNATGGEAVAVNAGAQPDPSRMTEGERQILAKLNRAPVAFRGASLRGSALVMPEGDISAADADARIAELEALLHGMKSKEVR